jgi:hypothetical protein
MTERRWQSIASSNGVFAIVVFRPHACTVFDEYLDRSKAAFPSRSMQGRFADAIFGA